MTDSVVGLPDIRVYLDAYDLISKIDAKYFLKDISVSLLKPPLSEIQYNKDIGLWVKVLTLTDELQKYIAKGYFRFGILSLDGTIYESKHNSDYRCDPHPLDFDFQFKQISHEILDPELIDEFRAFANRHNWTISKE